MAIRHIVDAKGIGYVVRFHASQKAAAIIVAGGGSQCCAVPYALDLRFERGKF
jgi:hypothetical protein